MSSSRYFASPLTSAKVNSHCQVLETRVFDIVQKLGVYRAHPEEIALEIVLAGASSLTSAGREAQVLEMLNSGFPRTVLGKIGDLFYFSVVTYINEIFEHFWSMEYTKGEQINSLKGVSGHALSELIGKLTAMGYLPYGHFQAFVCHFVTQFRSKEHLDCLLVMLRHATSLPAGYFILDEHFWLSATKALCLRSRTMFPRKLPEVVACISNLIHRNLLKGNHIYQVLDSDSDDGV